MATKESRVERLKVRGERLEAGIAAELQSNPISNSQLPTNRPPTGWRNKMLQKRQK